MGHTCCVRECEEERRNTDTYRFLGIRNLVESSFHTLFLYNLYYLFYLFIFFCTICCIQNSSFFISVIRGFSIKFF